MKHDFPYTREELAAIRRAEIGKSLDGGYIRCKYYPRIKNWTEADSEEFLAEYEHLFGHPLMIGGKKAPINFDSVFIAWGEMRRAGLA